MQDSDDNYFTDDLVLDDKTLAVLDEEESKFRRANSQTQEPTGPPAKRQKTTGSLQPHSTGRPVRRNDTLDDVEELPDVSVGNDGHYGLRERQRRVVSGPTTTWSGSASGWNGVARAGSVPRPPAAAPLSRGPVPPTRKSTVTGPARPPPAPSRPPSSVRSTRIAQSPAPSQDVSRAPQPVERNVPSTPASNAYVDQLLQQIEELRTKNEANEEAKFAKEGEVSILRKRMEKIVQDHSAQIAKFKSAKEDADAKYVSLQKQFEIDKERLKTELTFKRHELETASWRHVTPFSPKRDGSQTAGPLPSQRQRSSPWASPGPSRLAPETPRRPRFGVISDFDKPKSLGLDTRDLFSRDLPSGFQTGPPRSQSMMGRKGKETASSSAPFPTLVFPNASPMSQRSGRQFHPPDVFATQVDDGGPVGSLEDFAPHSDVGFEDVQMMDGTPATMPLSSQENTSALTLPSWNLILHGTILTHTLQGSNLPTLQLLVSVCPSGTVQARTYGAALLRIFDTLGGIPANPDSDFDHVARTLCCALCEITHLLAKNNLISPLTAILNLLTNLAMLPSTHTFLVSRFTPDGETPQLLQVLYHVIQNQLQKLDVTTGNEPPELGSLGKETLSLYEALVWWMPDGSEDSLNACPGMSSLFMTLLHPNRPPWFLVCGIRILLWLSTRRSLFHLLLSPTVNDRPSRNGETADLEHHLQINLACSLLTDTNRQGPEADELKSCIIIFFDMISNAHPDAYTLLIESPELIPSIVLFICHAVASIWDEDGAVLGDARAATRTVHAINYAMLLLHHLVISQDAVLDLRERLSHASRKTYQVLLASFILTFGRLSYADPPYWLGKKEKERLAGIAVLARALLERVIQGPELDLIWETYQDDGDESESETAMDVDDEEAGAQKVVSRSVAAAKS